MAPKPDRTMTSDDDSLSEISSPGSGEDEDGDVFDVETILDQRYDEEENRWKYLVKWDGYDLLNATWEPDESFNSEETLMDWERKKLEIASGTQPRFDVEKWERDYQKVYDEFEAAEKSMIEHNAELYTNMEEYFFPLQALPASLPSAPGPAREASITSTDSLFVSSNSVSRLPTPSGTPDRGIAFVSSRASQLPAPEASRLADQQLKALVPDNTPQQQASDQQPPRRQEAHPARPSQQQIPLASKPSQPEAPYQQASRQEKPQPSTTPQQQRLLAPKPPRPESVQQRVSGQENSQPPKAPQQQAFPSQRPPVSSPSRHEAAQQQIPQNRMAPSPRPYVPATKTMPPGLKLSSVPSAFQGFGQTARPRQKAGSHKARGDGQAPKITSRKALKPRVSPPSDLMKPSDYPIRENYGYATPSVRVRNVTNETAETSLAAEAPSLVQTPMGPPALPHSASQQPPSNAPAEEKRDRPREALQSPWSPDLSKGSRPLVRDNNSKPRAHGRQRSPGVYSRRPDHSGETDSYRPNYSRDPSLHQPGRSNREDSASKPQELEELSKSAPPSSPLSVKPFSGVPTRPTSRKSIQEPSQPKYTGGPLSEKEKISCMRVGSPTAGAKFFPGGHFSNPGELLVHVYFGTNKTFVGPLRIVKSTYPNNRDLFNYSKGRGKTLDLWFRHFYTMDEFPQFADVSFRGNAFLEGMKGPKFDETNTRLFRAGEYLLANKFAATCGPRDGVNTWIAYSPFSNFDYYLTRDFELPNDVPIALAIIDNCVPFITPSSDPRAAADDFLSTLQRPVDCPSARDNAGGKLDQRLDHGETGPVHTTMKSLHQDGQTESSPVSLPMVHPVRQSQILQPRITNKPSHTVGHDLESYASPTSGTAKDALLQRNVLPSLNLDSLSANQNDTDMTDGSAEVFATIEPTTSDSHEPIQFQGVTPTKICEMFEQGLNITIDELSNGVPRNFYLHFPLEDPDARDDLGFMEIWLDLKKVNYMTSRDPANWERFFKKYTEEGGVVLFHEAFFDFYKLRPKIKLLQARPKIIFWMIRISRPLDLPDIRFVDEEEKCHVQRLFPSGNAILLTEDIFQNMQQAALITYWFAFKKSRSEPGAYKLVFMPDVYPYLVKKLDDPNENAENKAFAFSIIVWIQHINSRDDNFPYFDPDVLDDLNTFDHPTNDFVSLPVPEYGTRPENQHPAIPQGLTQDERNADHLVEAFAGWMHANAFQFRKSLVVTNQTSKALSARWSEWGHVQVMDVNTFFRYYKIDEGQLLVEMQKPIGGSPHDQDVAM